ncbi:MAG: hypothetical protein KAX66_04615 [Propionivibrio sp.]|nr:hypothetical protein [Propionivibrio sp.]MBP8789259.1 hypothetical protein [Azonexus sp.]
MPTLREFMTRFSELLAQNGESFSESVFTQVENQMRRDFPAERIYIPPAGSRKDPARRENIAELSRRLPAGIVRERLGVSRQLVSYHIKKSKNAAG